MVLLILMLQDLTHIFLATIIVSLISFVGVFTLSLRKKWIKHIVILLVALSAGALLGDAFIHLLPEALEESEPKIVMLYTLIGFTLFLFIEKVLFWHHCHSNGGKCDYHSFAYINLVGDFVHNFIDGLVIAASFLVNFNVGITTTIAVILHEIPQEIGDFGVLLHGGFKRKQALLLNFLSALSAILGGIIGYVLATQTESVILFLVPFTAGGFIYIAATDLIPEIKKEPKLKNALRNFLIFIFGIIIMYLFIFLE